MCVWNFIILSSISAQDVCYVVRIDVHIWVIVSKNVCGIVCSCFGFLCW